MNDKINQCFFFNQNFVYIYFFHFFFNLDYSILNRVDVTTFQRKIFGDKKKFEIVMNGSLLCDIGRYVKFFIAYRYVHFIYEPSRVANRPTLSRTVLHFFIFSCVPKYFKFDVEQPYNSILGPYSLKLVMGTIK